MSRVAGSAWLSSTTTLKRCGLFSQLETLRTSVWAALAVTCSDLDGTESLLCKALNNHRVGLEILVGNDSAFVGRVRDVGSDTPK